MALVYTCSAVPEEVEEQEAEVKADTKLRDTKAGAMVIEAELPSGAIVTTLDGGLHNVYGAARTKVISMEEISAAVNNHKPFFTPDDKGERADGGTWVLTAATIRHATRSRQRGFNLQRRLRRLRKSDPEFAAAEAVWENSNINTTDHAELVAALKARGAVVHLMIKGYEGHNGHGSCFHLARARFDASIAEEACLYQGGAPAGAHRAALRGVGRRDVRQHAERRCSWLFYPSSAGGWRSCFPSTSCSPCPRAAPACWSRCTTGARPRSLARVLLCGACAARGIGAPASCRCALRLSACCLARRVLTCLLFLFAASCQKRSACSPETATARCSRTVCTGIFLLRCRRSEKCNKTQ